MNASGLPACVLVTHGFPFNPYPTPTPPIPPNGGNVQNPGITLEQPPPFTATFPANNVCCSIVYPPLICDYHSATCYYIQH